jgi:hypothetical protein
MQSTTTSTVSIPPIIKHTIQDLPIQKLYLNVSEVAEETGLSNTRIEFIAGKYLHIPQFINGNFKFKEKHINKIVEADMELRLRESRKIIESEEIAAKKEEDAIKKRQLRQKTKRDAARSARLRREEIERIQRRMIALSKYMSDQLQMLQDQMAIVARE